MKSTVVYSLLFLAVLSRSSLSVNQDILEKQCLKCSCRGDAMSEEHRESILKIMSQKFYFAMGSWGDIAWWGYLLLHGREATSKYDIDSLCLSGIWNLETNVSYFTGHGITATANFNFKTMSRIGLYNIEQLHDPMDMPNELSKIYRTSTRSNMLSFHWTDGRKFVLGTGCRWDGGSTWYLFSTTKKLTRKIKNRVIKKIAAIGFDPANAYAPDLSKC